MIHSHDTATTVTADFGGLITGDIMAKQAPVSADEKKIWLKRVKWAVNDLMDLQESKRDAMNQATSTTASYSATVVASTKNPHKFDAVTLIDACIEQKERQIGTLQREVMKAILTVKNDKQRKVLRALYIECCNIPQAADKLHFSEGHTKRLHREGIENIKITRTMIEQSKKRENPHRIKQ